MSGTQGVGGNCCIGKNICKNIPNIPHEFYVKFCDSTEDVYHPKDLGPIPMTYDSSLYSWIGQVDVRGTGPNCISPPLNSAYCGETDVTVDHGPFYDTSGSITLGVALRLMVKEAKLRAVVQSGKVTSVKIDDPGGGYWPLGGGYLNPSGYGGNPLYYSLIFKGGGGYGAVGYAIAGYKSEDGCPVEDTFILSGGSGYTFPPKVSILTMSNYPCNYATLSSIWVCTSPFGIWAISHGGVGWIPTTLGDPIGLKTSQPYYYDAYGDPSKSQDGYLVGFNQYVTGGGMSGPGGMFVEVRRIE